MKLNKLSFAIGNVFGTLVMSAMVVACGPGVGDSIVAGATGGNSANGSIVADATGGNTSSSTNYGTILASKIILAKRDITTGNNIIRVQANQLPSNVEVLASQVVVNNSTNSLRSSNLQTALDNEIAVDIATNIIGVWKVQNFDGGFRFTGPGRSDGETGVVEFKSDGTFTIISGGFAVAGQVAEGTAGYDTTAPNPIMAQGTWCPVRDRTFRIIDGIVQISAGGTTNAIVVKNTTDTITLMGGGAGCWAAGVQAITRMTRQVTAKPIATTPSTTTKSVIKTALNG